MTTSWAITQLRTPEVEPTLDLIATRDSTGGSSVWAAFMSKMGLASGPLIGGIVLGTYTFSSLKVRLTRSGFEIDVT